MKRMPRDVRAAAAPAPPRPSAPAARAARGPAARPRRPPPSPASRCARSSALQAALTTSSRWSPRLANIRSSRMPPASSVKSAVALPPRRQPEHVHRHQPLQRRRRVGESARARPQRDLAHVAHVEQPGRRAGVQVLLQDAGRVLHRHVVAGEGHHPRPERHVQRVQRRLRAARSPAPPPAAAPRTTLGPRPRATSASAPAQRRLAAARANPGHAWAHGPAGPATGGRARP